MKPGARVEASLATLAEPERKLSTESWEEMRGIAETAEATCCQRDGVSATLPVMFQKTAMATAMATDITSSSLEMPPLEMSPLEMPGLRWPTSWAWNPWLPRVTCCGWPNRRKKQVRQRSRPGTGGNDTGRQPVCRAIQARFQSDGRNAYYRAPSDDPLAPPSNSSTFGARTGLPSVHRHAPRYRSRHLARCRSWQRRRERGLMTPYWLCQRWIKLMHRRRPDGQASIAALVSHGGDFGLAGNVVAAESGAICGLLKAIIIESWVSGFRTIAGEDDRCAGRHVAPGTGRCLAWRELPCRVTTAKCAASTANVTWSGRIRNRPNVSRCCLLNRADPPRRRVGMYRRSRGITAYVVEGAGRRFGLKLHLRRHRARRPRFPIRGETSATKA